MNQDVLNIVQQINEQRTKADKRILWPDYEILRQLIRYDSQIYMYEYCNMTKLKIMRFKMEDDYVKEEEILGEYSHIWVEIKSQLNGQSIVIIYLTDRLIAIDSICKYRSTWVVEIFQLKRDVHVKGLILRPRHECEQKFKIVTTRNITKDKSRFILQFQAQQIQYDEIYILGTTKAPQYGRILQQDSYILINSVVLFEMAIVMYKSWANSQLEPELENFGKGIFTKHRLQQEIEKSQIFKLPKESKKAKSQIVGNKIKLSEVQKGGSQEIVNRKAKNPNKNIRISQCSYKKIHKTSNLFEISEKCLQYAIEQLDGAYEDQKKGVKQASLLASKKKKSKKSQTATKSQQSTNKYQKYQYLRCYLGPKYESYGHVDISLRELQKWGAAGERMEDAENKQLYKEIDFFLEEGMFMEEIYLGHLEIVKEVFEKGYFPFNKNLNNSEKLSCHDCLIVFLLIFKYFQNTIVACTFLYEGIKKITPQQWIKAYFLVNLQQLWSNYHDIEFFQCIDDDQQTLISYLNCYIIKYGIQIMKTQSFIEFAKDIDIPEFQQQIFQITDLYRYFSYCIPYTKNLTEEIELLNAMIKFSKCYSKSLAKNVNFHMPSKSKSSHKISTIFPENKIFYEQFDFLEDQLSLYKKDQKNCYYITYETELNQPYQMKWSKYQKFPSNCYQYKSEFIGIDSDKYDKISYSFTVNQSVQTIFTPNFEVQGVKFRLVYVKSHPSRRPKDSDDQQDQTHSQKSEENDSRKYDVYIQFLGPVEKQPPQIQSTEDQQNQSKRQNKNGRKTRRFISALVKLVQKDWVCLTICANSQQLIKLCEKNIYTATQKSQLQLQFNYTYEAFLNYYCMVLAYNMDYLRDIQTKKTLITYKNKIARQSKVIDRPFLQTFQKQSNRYRIPITQNLNLYESCFLHTNGRQCCHCYLASSLYDIEEDALKVILGSDLLEINHESSLLLFVTNYYEHQARSIVRKILKCEQQERKIQNHLFIEALNKAQIKKEIGRNIKGHLFTCIRYYYIPNHYVFNLALTRPWLTSVDIFYDILKQLVGNEYKFKEINNMERINQRQSRGIFKQDQEYKKTELYKEVEKATQKDKANPYYR